MDNNSCHCNTPQRETPIITINGDKIKKLRYNKGLSQFALSLETDLSRELIDSIENNHRKRSSLDTAIKLARFFKVNVEELI